MGKRNFYDLQEYVSYLKRIGDVEYVKAEVDPVLEVTEIADRVIKDEGPALIFEKVKGAEYPLAMNLFGTEERVELALGRKPRDVGEELVELFHKLNPPSIKSFFSILPKVYELINMRTRKVRHGVAQQIDEILDLRKLPIIKCWPLDGGKFITLGLVLTQDPVTSKRNTGIYRMQIYDERTTGMHWHPHKGGAAHYHEAGKLNKDLEVAVVLGGDPKMIFSAIAPLPEGMDELAFASYLRGNPIPMVKGKSIDVMVPANAEFILEGVVPQNELRREGPFGDHFGHYSMQADFPVYHLNQITHRANPIYPATTVGKPPKEDVFLGMAAGDMFSPLTRIIHPEVKDMWAYPEAGFHNLLVVAVDERYPKNGIKAMLALWGTGQLLLTKVIITISSDVNPRDWDAVLTEIGDNFDPNEDFLMIPWAPLDTLDFTSGKLNVGSKMGINAVRKPNCRRRNKPKPARLSDPRGKHKDILDWRLLKGGILVIKLDNAPKEMINEIFQTKGYEELSIIIVVSPDIDLHNNTELIWGIFTRFDPYLDVILERTELRGSAVVYGGRMGIDATLKRWYPKVIEMSDEIKEIVSERWKEYWKI